MNCKNCIHWDKCSKTNGKTRYYGETIASDNVEELCEWFISTADVAPKSEVEKLELTLQGVMWSVDKWLDEKDYDADPIKRAITMREKTLKIVENAKTEVAREIFEEIEKIRLNEIKRCEVMREKEYTHAQRNYWEGGEHSLRQLSYWIAELKKKYTGDNKE